METVVVYCYERQVRIGRECRCARNLGGPTVLFVSLFNTADGISEHCCGHGRDLFWILHLAESN